MLVNKQKYNSGDIVTMKISNGDEIVATFVEETDEGFMIKKPATVIPAQDGIVLMGTLFTSSSELPMLISFQHVMLHGLTGKKIADSYIHQTSGIQIAPAGSIAR